MTFMCFTAYSGKAVGRWTIVHKKGDVFNTSPGLSKILSKLRTVPTTGLQFGLVKNRDCLKACSKPTQNAPLKHFNFVSTIEPYHICSAQLGAQTMFSNKRCMISGSQHCWMSDRGLDHDLTSNFDPNLVPQLELADLLHPQSFPVAKCDQVVTQVGAKLRSKSGSKLGSKI
ncbi:hypothetical protein B0H10DRAFT_1958182 [Mycena sp. CBHHK59/15]|nr:hypothetical protein B0H10DRAFT_1958182 [Mycena sp. CBHHK59/15]